MKTKAFRLSKKQREFLDTFARRDIWWLCDREDAPTIAALYRRGLVTIDFEQHYVPDMMDFELYPDWYSVRLTCLGWLYAKWLMVVARKENKRKAREKNLVNRGVFCYA